MVQAAIELVTVDDDFEVVTMRWSVWAMVLVVAIQRKNVRIQVNLTEIVNENQHDIELVTVDEEAEIEETQDDDRQHLQWLMIVKIYKKISETTVYQEHHE